MIKASFAITAALLAGASLPDCAQAATFGFNFNGPGVSGTVSLTYGAATDAKYPNAFEVTGITGFFTDTNNGLNIVNVPIGPLVAITHDTPEPANLLAPHDFSRFPVASGLSPENNGFLTYDNLYWPGGSPPTASDYPLHGGFLDIYGLMFHAGDDRVVDLWSNGDPAGSGVGPIYGVAVATSSKALDYVGGVTATPEPGSLAMLGGGLLLLGLRLRRHRSANRAA